jgi:hypothetical protein
LTLDISMREGSDGARRDIQGSDSGSPAVPLASIAAVKPD